jgi:uncharacterized protein YbjT (DUF2867 family)
VATERVVLVTGATGRQGGAVTRHLLKDGWRVRALTRDPATAKAAALSALGAEVVRGDMADRESVLAAARGVHGVFSVQNPMLSGLDAEVRQGKNVADAAKEAGARHVVYGSAGVGRKTGVGSWDSKLEVEAHMKALALPLTVLRPMAFMELMTDKGYYPGASTWHVMPKLMGAARPVPWLAVDDLGAIVAKVFADPGRYVGADIKLASDVQSIDDCRRLYREVVGKSPSSFPMPVWLFKRFVGPDLLTMWRWLRDGDVELDPVPARTIHPAALTVRDWLGRQAPKARIG